MAKGFRKCKECEKSFKKRFPLDMFCSPTCESSYKKKKQADKNGLLHTKPKRSLSNEGRNVSDGSLSLSERDVFEQIWGTEPELRVSFVTGKILPNIHNAYPWYFSHILPKGRNRYPMFKFYKRNIVLKTFEEHTEWEHHQYRISGNDRWKHVFDLQRELKEEYEQHRLLFEAGKVEYYKI